jgi:hypothetical protein
MSYEEQAKMAYQTQPIARAERNSAELTVSVELKQLEGVINEIETASQDFTNRVAPILFFGPEKESSSCEAPSLPGSDLAQQLYRMRERLRGTVAFLNNMGQKVNL